MKKLFAALFIAVIACLALIGCNANNQPDNQPQKNTYTVTFDSQGGNSIASQEVLEGNPVKRPETPERDGYFLNGWYTSSLTTADTEWNFDTDRVTKDITLYAGWTVVTSQEPTDKLIYKQEGNAYTITGTTSEDTVLIIPSEYDGLPVTKIQGEYGTGAFARKAITSVTIPDSIVEIGQNSFHNCNNLETVKISTTSSLATIGNNAFSGNSSLKSIYIPTGMAELGDSVFNNCGALEAITVAANNAVYRSENGHLIERASETLIRGCNNGAIPSGVKVVAQAAFRKTQDIEKLSIPKSVESIANYIIADSSIEYIDYAGTETEWNAISKAKLWNLGKENVQITFAPVPVEDENEDSGILVVYFSCTNNTEKIAGYISEVTGGTLYEITPEIPYASADLDYNSDCRANREQNDPSARPAISGNIENIEDYSLIFLGYPIWWGQAPKIIYTLLESYDFSGKTIVPFCTSGSSGIGLSATNLHGLTTGATWKDGRRFSSLATKSQVKDWIESENYIVQEEITKMYVSVNGNKLEVTLENNSSVDALVAILKQGDIVFTATENGGFEIYGDIGHTLPTNNTQITAQAGDVILYAGHYICLFCGSNSWSYTRIGKINGYTAQQLKTMFGAGSGSVQVTISLK